MSSSDAQLYERVINALVGAIRDGTYPAGARLPTELDLAREYGTSRSTIGRAMTFLKYFALVIGRRGSGYRVAKEPVRTEALQLFDAMADLRQINNGHVAPPG